MKLPHYPPEGELFTFGGHELRALLHLVVLDAYEQLGGQGRPQQVEIFPLVFDEPALVEPIMPRVLDDVRSFFLAGLSDIQHQLRLDVLDDVGVVAFVEDQFESLVEPLVDRVLNNLYRRLGRCLRDVHRHVCEGVLEQDTLGNRSGFFGDFQDPYYFRSFRVSLAELKHSIAISVEIAPRRLLLFDNKAVDGL